MMIRQDFEVADGRKVYFEPALAASTPSTRTMIADGPPACLSVIIPTMDRRELETCIRSVIGSLQAGSLTANLVVVDQSTGNRSFAEAASLRAAGQTGISSVIYHHDVSLTISSAKNKAVELLFEHIPDAASPEGMLVFVDSDIYMTRPSMSCLIRAARCYPDAAFSLPSAWLLHDRQLAWLESPPAYDDLRPADICKPEPGLLQSAAANREGSILHVPAIHGCVVAIRPAAFTAVKGFHELYAMHGEHVDLCARLRDHQLTMAYVLDSIVLHDDRQVEASVTRNLDGREQYILATLIAMCARRDLSSLPRHDGAFLDLARSKWLPMANIAANEIPDALQLAVILGDIVDSYKQDIADMASAACDVIDQFGLAVASSGYFTDAMGYLHRNHRLLT